MTRLLSILLLLWSFSAVAIFVWHWPKVVWFTRWWGALCVAILLAGCTQGECAQLSLMPQIIVGTTNADTNTFFLVLGWSEVTNALSYNIYSWPVNVSGTTNKASVTNVLLYTNTTCWETDEWNFAVTAVSNSMESAFSTIIEYPFLNHKWQLQLSSAINGPWTNSALVVTNPFSQLFQRWINTTNW